MQLPEQRTTHHGLKSERWTMQVLNSPSAMLHCGQHSCHSHAVPCCSLSWSGASTCCSGGNIFACLLSGMLVAKSISSTVATWPTANLHLRLCCTAYWPGSQMLL